MRDRDGYVRIAAYVVPVAQWQSASLWIKLLWVRPPSATPKTCKIAGLFVIHAPHMRIAITDLLLFLKKVTGCEGVSGNLHVKNQIEL